jgi:macrodomain Ter protein organizer (MatP/YcbG family)
MHDVTPILKWLKQHDEAEVRRLFEQTMHVRRLSPAAQELADRFFFETVVRLHRAGEGAPYIGLRSDEPEPVVKLTDDSLSSGSPEALLQGLNSHLRSELTKRFEAARAAKSKSAYGVEAGRQYVSTYVELTHFVERVHGAMLAPDAQAHSHD